MDGNHADWEEDLADVPNQSNLQSSAPLLLVLADSEVEEGEGSVVREAAAAVDLVAEALEVDEEVEVKDLQTDHPIEVTEEEGEVGEEGSAAGLTVEDLLHAEEVSVLVTTDSVVEAVDLREALVETEAEEVSGKLWPFSIHFTFRPFRDLYSVGLRKLYGPPFLSPCLTFSHDLSPFN